MPLTSRPAVVAAPRASALTAVASAVPAAALAFGRVAWRAGGRRHRQVAALALVLLLGAGAALGLLGDHFTGVAQADDVSSLPCGQNGGLPGPGSGSTTTTTAAAPAAPLISNLRVVAKSTAPDGTVRTWGGAGQPVAVGLPNANGAPELTGADLVPIDLDGDGTTDVRFGLGSRTSSAATASSGPSSIQNVLTQNFRLAADGPAGSVALHGLDIRATGEPNASVQHDLVELGLRFEVLIGGAPVTQELSFGLDARPSATTAPRLPDDARITLGTIAPPAGSDPQTSVIAFGQDVSWNGIAAAAQPAIPLTYDLHRVDTSNPNGIDAKLRFGWQSRTPTETGFGLRNVCSRTNLSFRSTTHVAWNGNNLSGTNLGLDFSYGVGRGVAGGEELGLHGTITSMSSRADAIVHPDGLSLNRSGEQPNMTITLDRFLSAPHGTVAPPPGTPERVVLVSGQLTKVPPHLVVGILHLGAEVSGYDMACDLTTNPPTDDLLPIFPGGCHRLGLVPVDTISVDYRNYLPTDPAAAALVSSGLFEDGVAGHSNVIYEKTATLGGVTTKSFMRLGTTLHGIKQIRLTLLPHAPGENAVQALVQTGGAPTPFDVIVHADDRTTADRTVATGGTKVDVHGSIDALPSQLTLQARAVNSESWSVTADTSAPIKLAGTVDVYAPGAPVQDVHGAVAVDGAVGGGGLPTHMVLSRSRADADGVAEQTFTWSANAPTQVRVGATIGAPPSAALTNPIIQPLPVVQANVLAGVEQRLDAVAADGGQTNIYVPNPNAPKPRLRLYGAVTVPQDVTVAVRRVLDTNGQPGDVITTTATACNGVVSGCADDVDVTADYEIPQVPDGDLLVAPLTPKHAPDLAPAFGDLGTNQGVNFVRLQPSTWGGRLHLKNVAFMQYSNSTGVTMPGSPAQQVCLKSNPANEPFIAQLFASSPGVGAPNAAYVNAVLSRFPGTLYATMQPNVEQPSGGVVPPVVSVPPVLTDGGATLGPDTVSTTNGFFVGDTCYSLAPSTSVGEATQDQGGTNINAIVRYGNENKMRQLGAIHRLNRQVPAIPPINPLPIDTPPIGVVMGAADGPAPAPSPTPVPTTPIGPTGPVGPSTPVVEAAPATPSAPAAGKASEVSGPAGALAGDAPLSSLSKDDALRTSRSTTPSPDDASGVVSSERRRTVDADTDTAGDTTKTPVTGEAALAITRLVKATWISVPVAPVSIDPTPTAPLPPTTPPLPPPTTVPVPPKVDTGKITIPPGGIVVAPLDVVEGGPGIDVRGRVDGDGLAIDVHVVETLPRWFAVYPVTSRTCEPGQTCQWLESYEQEHRRKLDVKTRSSLKTLGELSVDLTVNQQAGPNAPQYRILGRVENVPASLQAKLDLTRNDRLPWTDLDLSLTGRDALKNIAVEVFDGSSPAHTGPAVGSVSPLISCTQVAGLCDRDPRPAPGGAARAYPDPWGQTPTYRIGLANVTNRLTVHGVLRDSDKPTNDPGFTPPGSQPDDACSNKPLRSTAQHSVYTHLDVDLKNQATRLDLTKHTGIDGSGTNEYWGNDLQPGSGSSATAYTPGSLPESTGMTFKADAPIDAALRVRVDGIHVKAHEHRDFDVAGFDVASIDVTLCDDVDLPFEVGFHGVRDARFVQSGAEFGLDLTPSDIAAGGWGRFTVHELLKTGDQLGSPGWFRENAVDMSWLASGPNGDIHDGPVSGGTKGVRLMPNAPACHLPHYHYDSHNYRWVQDGSNLGMCYWPGASEEPAGQLPGWNELNSTTLGIFTQQRATDVGGYKRLGFLADLLFSDSMLNNLYVRDAYGPVDPNGPGDVMFRAIAKQGVLPVDFRLPYVSAGQALVENSSSTNPYGSAIGRDGTTYSWDQNSHLVARFPNGQIRWVRHFANPASSFQWRVQTLGDGSLWNTYQSPSWSPNPVTIIHTYDASGTQTR